MFRRSTHQLFKQCLDYSAPNGAGLRVAVLPALGRLRNALADPGKSRSGKLTTCAASAVVVLRGELRL